MDVLIGVMHGQMGRSVYRAALDAWVVMFEPGDKTHYEFMWCAGPTPGFVRVAGLPDLKMYEYKIEDILRCYEENRRFVGSHELPNDGYLGYIRGHSGHCNKWTAWAMVQCIAEHVLWMNKDEEEQTGQGQDPCSTGSGQHKERS